MNSHAVLTAVSLVAAIADVRATANRSQAPSVRVPRRAAPVIDGKLSTEEWSGSYAAMLSDGSQLKLRHDGKYLYLAVRGAKPGFPSVCVTRGDTTRILHSSAALGAAAYVGSGRERSPASTFKFAMRSADTGSVRVSSQRAYLLENRWVANNSAMSQTEREMQIDLSLLDRDNARLALGYYVIPTESSVSWPNVDDGCTTTKTVQGWLPSTPLVFDTPRWASLVFE